MEAAAAAKSRGMTFAEQQLIRHGWEQGKGLGRGENGISEAIKVKVKCGKGGVGHKESEQFTFHWWDHVFNKASASLAVESGQNGVAVKKIDGEDGGAISNKKPRRAMLNKSALYGCFVKSATLLSGQEQPTHSSSSSEDDDEKLDLSSSKKLSDAELMKACGGRTAHKGARHGLTMSAKLARLEQQEQEFMAKYGKKRLTDQTPQGDTVSDQGTVVKTTHKKAKKKKQHSDELENGTQEDKSIAECLQKHHNERKKQAKHKPIELVDDFVDNKTETKKKLKFLETLAAPRQDADRCSVLDEDCIETLQQCDEYLKASDPISKKVKKKKKKQIVGEEFTESHEQEQQNEKSVELQPTCDRILKRKKKKKSSSKPDEDDSCMTEMGSHYSLENSSAEHHAQDETLDKAAVKNESLKAKKRKKRSRVVQEVDPLDGFTEKKRKSKKHEK